MPSCFCVLMDIQMQLAINLRRIRTLRGISQEELAYTSGVERAYVGHLERGKKNPTIKTLDKLAETLGCRVADFFADVDEEATFGMPLPAGRKRKSVNEEPPFDSFYIDASDP